MKLFQNLAINFYCQVVAHMLSESSEKVSRLKKRPRDQESLL